MHICIAQASPPACLPYFQLTVRFFFQPPFPSLFFRAQAAVWRPHLPKICTCMRIVYVCMYVCMYVNVNVIELSVSIRMCTCTGIVYLYSVIALSVRIRICTCTRMVYVCSVIKLSVSRMCTCTSTVYVFDLYVEIM